MTLRDYRIDLGWSLNRLATEAGIARQTAGAAEDGKPIHAETAKALADALTRALGRHIGPRDIEGLNIV